MENPLRKSRAPRAPATRQPSRWGAESARIPGGTSRGCSAAPLCQNVETVLQTPPGPSNGLDRHAILRGKRPGLEDLRQLGPPGKCRDFPGPARAGPVWGEDSCRGSGIFAAPGHPGNKVREVGEDSCWGSGRFAAPGHPGNKVREVGEDSCGGSGAFCRSGKPIFWFFYGARGRNRSKPLCIRGVFFGPSAARGRGAGSHAHTKAKKYLPIAKKNRQRNTHG